MKNKIIAILLVLILSVNFIGECKVKANPAIPIVGGAALLGFLLTASAIGLEFNSVAEANKIMEDFESKNNFNGSPNKPPNFSKIGLILGLVGITAKETDDKFAEMYREYRDNLVDYLKTTFLDLVEGENNANLNDYTMVSHTDNIYENGYYLMSYYGKYLPFYFNMEGDYFHITFLDGNTVSRTWSRILDNTQYKFLKLGGLSVYQGYYFSCDTHFSGYDRGSYIDDYVNSFDLKIPNSEINILTNLDDLPSADFSFNINPESPLLDETKPDLPNKPNITGLENVKEVVNNNGTTSYIYNGTSDELVQELINTISLDRLVNPNDYTMTEKENGQITVTPPDSNINPFEQTDSSNEVGLLQQIINWLKRLWELPTTIIQDLFTVPEDLTLDTSKLRLNQFQLKFPFSIPWDLYKSIEVFAVGMSDPSLEIDLDTEFFQVYHKIDLSKIALPLSFFRYCVVMFFIMFLINKTRDLIKW